MNIIRMTFLLISCFLNRGLLAKEKFNECINNVCMGDTLAKVERQGYVNTQSDGEEFYRRKSTFKKDGFEITHIVNINGPQKTVCTHILWVEDIKLRAKRTSDIIAALTGVNIKVPTGDSGERKSVFKKFSNGEDALFSFRNDTIVTIFGPSHCPKIKLEGFPASIIRSSTKSKR